MKILNKNDKIEIVIDAISAEGSGIGRYEGMTIFVAETVIGDKIIAHIIKVSKNYAVGKVDEILSPSPNRINSACPVSHQCGGCVFRQMTYEEELKAKWNRVNDALHRIAKIDITPDEIVPAPQTDRYRNKGQYPVLIENGVASIGFYAFHSHRIVKCEDCLLQPIEFEMGISAFQKWIKKSSLTSYDEETGKGFLRHIYFRKAFATGEIMACAVINGNSAPNADYLIECLVEAVPNLKSVVININKEQTNVILGKISKTIWGSDQITDVLSGLKFTISPNSFYQINPVQTEKLYSIVREYAQLTGEETILDLYCGAGTIGLTMADRAKKIVGVEIVSSAVKNAKENAKLNKITNAEFLCGDAVRASLEFTKMKLNPDVIILDPPRKGCEKEVVQAVAKMEANKIIYVSCDPATLSRDLAIFNELGYLPTKITPVDLFPRTAHVEMVALLQKKSS